MSAPVRFLHRYEPGESDDELTLLLLHGTGGDEQDLLDLGRALDDRAALVSPRGQVSESGSNRWFRRHAIGVFDTADLLARTDELAGFVVEAVRAYELDSTRLVAVGFSNGANIAATVLLRHPGLLRAAILFAPMLPLEHPRHVDLSRTDVFIGAGRADTTAAPEQAEELADLLTDRGAAVQVRWHAGGHGIDQRTFAQAASWLGKVRTAINEGPSDDGDEAEVAQMTRSDRTAEQGWPALRVDEWSDTRDTLHMWMQVVGKIRLATESMVNHWWQVPLYPTARGLTTSSMPYGERVFDIEFDLCEHRMHLRSSDGGHRQVDLAPKPVSQFYRETFDALRDLGIEITIRTKPVEVVQAIPFQEDTQHTAYDPQHAHLFWRQLLAAHRVLTEFRSRFIGKVSPVHFFWGAMDLATTRFSGRTAPRHPGGAPNCADWVMVEGYSHELSSCGFWPGGGEEGAFYAYAYPEPAGFSGHGVRHGHFSADLGEFVLPYETVRTASDPDNALLEFLQDSYEAVADNAAWDRTALEANPSLPEISVR